MPTTSSAAKALSAYIQIDTSNPPGRERAAAEWLADQLRRRGVTNDIRLLGPDPARPILVARIAGQQDDLQPLLLNHHMDVVPALAEDWSHGPFSGDMVDGYVWGRGALDTKSLGVMFLLALEQLLASGRRPQRPILFVAVPDEETNGSQGAGWLVENQLQDLNPAWVWDEGGFCVEGMLPGLTVATVSVAEKLVSQVRLTATDIGGHGAMPRADSAPRRLVRALARLERRPRPLRINAVTGPLMQRLGSAMPGAAGWLMRHLGHPLLGPLVRAVAGPKLAQIPALAAMLRDTVSLTMLEASDKINVIPATASAGLDCRLLPDTDPAAFQAWLRDQLGEDIAIEPLAQSEPAQISPVASPFMDAIERAIAQHMPGALVAPIQMPAGSDARFYRRQGVPAYGLAPALIQQDDMQRVHGVDERISIESLDLAVTICRDVIDTLCFQPTEGDTP